MQSLPALNPIEESLTRAHAPRLVADIDEDVVAAIEGAEGEAPADGRELEDLLRDEHGFFECFAGEAVPGLGDDADGSGLED